MTPDEVLKCKYHQIIKHAYCTKCFHTWVWVGCTLPGRVGWCHSLCSQRCRSTGAWPAERPPSSVPVSLPFRAICTSHCQSQTPRPVHRRSLFFKPSSIKVHCCLPPHRGLNPRVQKHTDGVTDLHLNTLKKSVQKPFIWPPWGSTENNGASWPSNRHLEPVCHPSGGICSLSQQWHPRTVHLHLVFLQLQEKGQRNQVTCHCLGDGFLVVHVRFDYLHWKLDCPPRIFQKSLTAWLLVLTPSSMSWT